MSEVTSTNGADHNEETIEPSELEQKIISQVEYYFGDANLPRDKFMLEQIKIDNGWIPMSTLLKFQRLARISTDEKIIAEALKKSNLMEIDESNSEVKVRRSPEFPIPEFNAERLQAIKQRTVYCKGFPLDADLDAVLNVIKTYASPENVIMRKYKNKLTQTFHFKGSIFVTFKTKEEAEEFLKKNSVKVGEKDLIIMWQEDYLESKKKKHSEVKRKDEPQIVIPEFKKGATIHLAGEFGDITREEIREALETYKITPSYIAFNKGDKEAYFRLSEENSAKDAVEKLSDLTVKDVKLTPRALEGEEEERYLEKAMTDRRERMERVTRNKRGGRHGGQKKFKRRGGRRNDEDNDEPPKKKAS